MLIKKVGANKLKNSVSSVIYGRVTDIGSIGKLIFQFASTWFEVTSFDGRAGSISMPIQFSAPSFLR